MGPRGGDPRRRARRRVADVGLRLARPGRRRLPPAGRHPDARAGRPHQPHRAGLRAAGPPRAGPAPAPALAPRGARGAGLRGDRRPDRRRRRTCRAARRERCRACGARALPRRRRRCPQRRAAVARGSDARPRSPRGRRHRDVPRSALGRPRRAPLRHLRHPAPRGAGRPAPGGPRRSLDGRVPLEPGERAARRLRREPDARPDPARDGRRRPAARDRADRLLHVCGADRATASARAARS